MSADEASVRPAVGDADTIQDRSPVRHAAPTDGEPSHSTVSPEVLDREEHQTRRIALAVLLLAYIAISVLTLQTRLYGSGRSLMLTIALANVLLVGVLLVVSRRRRYSDATSTGVGVSGASMAFAACIFVGIDSAATIGLAPLVYYFGLGNSMVRRRVVVGFTLIGYSTLIVLCFAGVLPFGGLLQRDRQTSETVARGRTLSLAVIQILVLTSWLARRSRHTTLQAMAALDHARVGIRRRDALLQEANANIDRAMDDAKVGRFTGQTFDGLVIGKVIGRGAIGEVYEARDVKNDRRVAVKVLHSHLEIQPDHIARFVREVQITTALRSPNIPQTYGSGSAPDGSPYFAMELLTGTDLATELRRSGRLEMAAVGELVTQTSRALQVAHDAGIVHRDIKPQNIFRTDTEPPVWKVLDFGVSKFASGGGTLTQGAAIGTPAYMAPEQVGGEDVDARVDVFALCVVVYRAITGRPAFSGPSEIISMLRASRTQPARPGEFAEFHPDIDAVLALGLAKSRARRIGSVADFERAWHDATRGALDPAIRRRAAKLLEEQPWGADVEPHVDPTVSVAGAKQRSS